MEEGAQTCPNGQEGGDRQGHLQLQLLLHLHHLPGQVGQKGHLENIVEPLLFQFLPQMCADHGNQRWQGALEVPSELVNWSE